MASPRLDKPSPGKGLIYASLVFVAAVWGGTFLVIKALLQTIPPFGLAAFRLGLASLALLLYLLVSGDDLRVHRGDLSKLALLGVLGHAWFQLSLIAGLRFTTPSHSVLLVNTSPIFATILAALFLKEPFTRSKGVGILMAFVGVAALTTAGEGLHLGGAVFLGDLITLGAGFSFGLYSVLAKPLILRSSTLKVTAISTAFGTLALLPFGTRQLLHLPWPTFSPITWSGLLYISFFSLALNYILWNFALSKLEVARVAVFGNLTPFFTILLSALLLHEPITLSLVAGGTAVIVGASLVQRG